MALMVIAAFFPNLWKQMAIVSPYPTAYSLTLAIPPILLLTGLVSPGNRRYLLVGSALLLNLLVLFGVERVAETRSPKTLAQVINSRWQADSIIVGFQNYSQSISFYTGQPLFLFQTQGELEFGLQQRPENPYFLGFKTQLPELLKQHANFFIIIDQHNLEFFQTLYTEPITILTQWKKYLLITKP